MIVEESDLPAWWKVTYCEYHDRDSDVTDKNVIVEYYLDDEEDYDKQIPDFNEIAIQGQAVFVAEANSFFGSDEYLDFESECLVNPKWIDMFKVFRQQIEVTSDTTYAILEGFRPVNYSDVRNVQSVARNRRDNIPFYELIICYFEQHS